MRVNGPAVTLLITAFTVLSGCTGPFGEDPAPENPVETCGELEATYAPDIAYAPRVHLNTTNGSIELAVFRQQVPVTATNFLGFVIDGFYDGTRFHRLAPGEFIQGGDPLTTEENKRFWGTGGPGYSIPDEFHQFLRHDQPGTVTMAVGSPNSGGSQFMITMRPAEQLDDKASVFARVVDGMDTVQALARTPTDDRGRPQFNAELFNATASPPPTDPSTADVELTAYGYDCVQLAEPGGQAEYLLAVRNTGQRLMNGTFEADLPEGWDVSLRRTDPGAYPIPAGQTRAVILEVDVPDDASVGDRETFEATFKDKASEASISLELELRVDELGPSPVEGDQVRVESVGVLEDGRIFATTMGLYAEDPWLTWFDTDPRDGLPAEPIADPPAEELSFTLGEDQLRVQGLMNATGRAKQGQAVVEAVSPSEAYGTEAWGQNNLGGKLLIFQLELVDVEKP